MSIFCENNVLILPSCKTDNEDIISTRCFIYIWNIWDFWKHDILILVYYIVWHSLFVLETGLFKFIKLYDKALRSIALIFWLTTLNRSLQVFCLALLTLTCHSDTSEWGHPRCSGVFTSDFGQVNSYFLFRLRNLI